MKNCNNLLILLFILIFNHSYAQIGINTNTPQEDLHVNGNLQVTKDIILGGDASNKGSSGNQNDVLSSQGVGKASKWIKIDEVSVIPYVIGIFNFQSNTTNTSGSTTQVNFNTFTPIKDDYISFNEGSREITISKKGFYRFYSSLAIDTSANSSGYTAGEARSSLFRNDVLLVAKSTTHGERTLVVNHNIYGIGYFNVGDKLILKVYRFQNYRITSASLTLLYSGDNV